MVSDPLSVALWLGALAARGAAFVFDDELFALAVLCMHRWPPIALA